MKPDNEMPPIPEILKRQKSYDACSIEDLETELAKEYEAVDKQTALIKDHEKTRATHRKQLGFLEGLIVRRKVNARLAKKD